MKLSEFIRPKNLAEARRTLRGLGPKGMALAGGTALHFMQGKTPVAAVDLTGLGLSYIKQKGDFFVIGAATPLSDIQRWRGPRWAMHEICRRISTHQVRNVSTIGGNICRVFPWADLPVVLLAMGARMVIYSGKEKEMTADEYFSSQPARLFRNGDILTAVKIPVLKAHHGFGSVKATRNAAAFSLVTIAALLELDGTLIKSARVAAGSGIPFPQRLKAVEAELVGKEASAATFKAAAAAGGTAAKWVGGEGMSADYIRQLAEVSILDSLERAAEFARGRAE